MFPMAPLSRHGGLVPRAAVTQDCSSGHREKPGLGDWVKAEEDLFQNRQEKCEL